MTTAVTFVAFTIDGYFADGMAALCDVRPKVIVSRLQVVGGPYGCGGRPVARAGGLADEAELPGTGGGGELVEADVALRSVCEIERDPEW